jgi:hypothetical protein
MFIGSDTEGEEKDKDRDKTTQSFFSSSSFPVACSLQKIEKQ